MKTRALMVCVAASALVVEYAGLAWLLTGCASVVHEIGGASSRTPSEAPKQLSPKAKALYEEVYSGTDAKRLADYHVHIVGLGENCSGCYANARMLRGGHLFDRLRFEVYCSAGRVTSLDHAESQYAARLLDLAKTAPGRFLLLAFDENRGSDGQVNQRKTQFHVPNDHALGVALAAPEHFSAAGSVHPLRPGACAELRRLHAKGVRVIKWLPNAMAIDPANANCDRFYETLRELNMALLTHGGKEAAMNVTEDQELGNPQHLQRALGHGVKVIVAHCASLGKGNDSATPGGPPVENWKLLLRMMDDPRWNGLLFADISATTMSNRPSECLRAILTRADLHPRLVNGSDYPLPAVNTAIWLWKWVQAGLLDREDVAPLQELYDVNPLVFDFALKRRLRVIEANGKVTRFAVSIFHENAALPLAAARG